MSILNDVTVINAFFCSHGDAEDGEDSRKKQLRQMFNRLAGDDNEIDSEELQDILTTSLKKGTTVIIILYHHHHYCIQISLSMCLILLLVAS